MNAHAGISGRPIGGIGADVQLSRSVCPPGGCVELLLEELQRLLDVA